MKHIHFRASSKLIDELDAYRTRWRSRSELLEEAISLFINENKKKQVKVVGSSKKQVVMDWRDTL